MSRASFSICLARFGGAHVPVLDCANGYQKENQKAARKVEEDHQQEGNAEEETGEEKAAPKKATAKKAAGKKATGAKKVVAARRRTPARGRARLHRRSLAREQDRSQASYREICRDCPTAKLQIQRVSTSC